MKKDVRFLGIDDSPFRFIDEHVRIVGVVTRGASYVEGVLSGRARVDGDDATQAVADLVGGSRFRPLVRAVFLNGVTVGGFNVVDLDVLYDSLQIPLVAVVRKEPGTNEVEAAIAKHFVDAKARREVLSRLRPAPVENGRYTVWCSWRGVEKREVGGLLAAATVRGAIPEPLRLAHVIASGIARGESRGPA